MKPQRFLPSLRLPASVALAFILVAALAAGCASPGGSQPRKVLVVTVTTGFRHSSIETAERVIEQLGRDSGAFTVDFARVTPPPAPSKPAEPKDTGDAEKLKADREKYEAALEKFREEDARYQPEAKRYAEEQTRVLAEKMSPAALQQYAGVIFANTTGDIPLPDPQGFVDWVKAGHGFAATHSGSDTFHGFKPYIEMLGGEFLTHGAQATVDCVNQDTKHAACQHLPARWTVRDEIYLLKSFTRSSVHGLLTLEKHPNSGEPGDYPIAWCKQFGKGRVFYTSLGHREDVWDPNTPAGFKRQNSKEVSLAYQQHLLNGIKWTLGLANGSAKP